MKKKKVHSFNKLGESPQEAWVSSCKRHYALTGGYSGNTGIAYQSDSIHSAQEVQ